MAVSILNQYKASYADSTSLSAVAETLEEAIVALKQTKPNEPTLIQKTVSGIAVSVPDPAIAIRTTVVGEGAVEGGCKATPYTIASIENGDKVWFTAITADNFQFDGWYLNDEQLSTEESFEAVIAYSGTAPVELNYEARFSAL